MPAMSQGGGGSIGSLIGKAVSKTVKKTAGKSAGKSASKAVRSVRRSSSSSGSSSGRRASGGSVRRSTPKRSSPRRASPPPARPAKPPITVPSIDKFLGMDSIYQNIARGGKRSLADFLSEMGRRRGEAGTQFTQTKSSMERDRVQQLEDLRNEFASRGLIQSGLYGEEQGRFQQQFAEQSRALEQQQAALLADLLSQEKNYRREQELALEAAKQEALARRAAKYKIGA